MGMSQVDFLKVIQEVTIVFHVAASISFMKPLRFMLKHNAKALDYVIDLCKELKKLMYWFILLQLIQIATGKKDTLKKGSGMVDLGLAIGKGFVRVLRGNPGVKIDIIPVDVVANAHIAAAWSVAAKRSSSPLVVNCTSSDVSECTLHDYTSTLFNMTMKHPLPKSYQKQSITIQKEFYTVLAVLSVRALCSCYCH
ncbi:fatty acyl-CoA reductase [Caerostris extrusa]|uniref:Fatty acyl-CoA reductase n=1 Tax=Caerostris extrusa TaxID=172846 RepID=A0AAV4M952_CAEEX|nr:fatty acyl-CoA reductase [Caerostris extrusa]